MATTSEGESFGSLSGKDQMKHWLLENKLTRLEREFLAKDITLTELAQFSSLELSEFCDDLKLDILEKKRLLAGLRDYRIEKQRNVTSMQNMDDGVLTNEKEMDNDKPFGYDLIINNSNKSENEGKNNENETGYNYNLFKNAWKTMNDSLSNINVNNKNIAISRKEAKMYNKLSEFETKVVQLISLIECSDNHPYNLDKMVNETQSQIKNEINNLIETMNLKKETLLALVDEIHNRKKESLQLQLNQLREYQETLNQAKTEYETIMTNDKLSDKFRGKQVVSLVKETLNKEKIEDKLLNCIKNHKFYTESEMKVKGEIMYGLLEYIKKDIVIDDFDKPLAPSIDFYEVKHNFIQIEYNLNPYNKSIFVNYVNKMKDKNKNENNGLTMEKAMELAILFEPQVTEIEIEYALVYNDAEMVYFCQTKKSNKNESDNEYNSSDSDTETTDSDSASVNAEMKDESFNDNSELNLNLNFNEMNGIKNEEAKIDELLNEDELVEHSEWISISSVIDNSKHKKHNKKKKKLKDKSSEANIIKIKNLKSEREYLIRARVKNMNGWSKWCEAKTVETPIVQLSWNEKHCTNDIKFLSNDRAIFKPPSGSGLISKAYVDYVFDLTYENLNGAAITMDNFDECDIDDELNVKTFGFEFIVNRMSIYSYMTCIGFVDYSHIKHKKNLASWQSQQLGVKNGEFALGLAHNQMYISVKRNGGLYNYYTNQLPWHKTRHGDSFIFKFTIHYESHSQMAFENKSKKKQKKSKQRKKLHYDVTVYHNGIDLGNIFNNVTYGFTDIEMPRKIVAAASYQADYLNYEYGDISVKYLTANDFSPMYMNARKIWYNGVPWFVRVYLYRILIGLMIFIIAWKADYGIGFWLSCLWAWICKFFGFLFSFVWFFGESAEKQDL